MLTTFFANFIGENPFFMILLSVISSLLAFIIGSLLISKLSTSGKKLHSLYPGMARTLSVLLVLQYILYIFIVVIILIFLLIGISEGGKAVKHTNTLPISRPHQIDPNFSPSSFISTIPGQKQGQRQSRRSTITPW
jgi:hypothetical protein